MSEHDRLPERPEDQGSREAAAAGDSAAGGGDIAPGTSIDMLAAALRRDSADLEIYTKVLTESLAEALPPGSVTFDRKRTVSDRLAGRNGKVEKLEVSLDDRRLILTLAHGHPQGEVATVVRGVVLSRKPVALDEWARELATAVGRRAQSDARARAALQKLVLGD
ncbi:hypothetical protein [Streptomyces sp. NBC_01190]|uniref:hypothetical protein n=1 Tax=Streptomyces sp. NBC_01190 TaxID=2903767 RepID=UPI00386BFD80|nr:hypothetical protein OG519_23920 [Streptomyces sp. NBC_01190]